MKKVFLLSAVGILFFAASSIAQNNKTNNVDKTLPKITFKELSFDFGKIPYKGNGQHVFVFKNEGKKPLIISDVKTSCGCTTPEWSKEPIMKGKEGKIIVKYDTSRIGTFSKTITINSNAVNTPITLSIKGDVQQVVDDSQEKKESPVIK